jgi:CheY-like chemotaxis protein
MDRIFEPFFTTKKQGEGTGMGLAVVHGIVRRHNGAIMGYSEPGKGTTFRIYFPRVKAKATSEPPSTRSHLKGNERILFVDDEEQMAELWKQALEKLGYAVTAETKSIEALETFRAQPDQFDLIVTDLTMPQKTGFELSKEIRRICPHIPIILCTGFGEKTTSEQLRKIGIQGLASKPISTAKMAEIIRHTIDRHS